MKFVKAWPRWLQVVAGTVAVLAVVGAAIAVDFGAEVATPAQRTPLAVQFEAQPQAWLAHPADVSQFERALAARTVTQVGIDGTRVLYTLAGGERFSAGLLSTQGGLVARLEALSREQGFALTPVHIDTRSTQARWIDGTTSVLQRLVTLLALGGLAFLIVHLVRQQSGAGSGAARLAETPSTTFADVIGASEAKAALQQVTAFMRDPQKYLALGAKPPRGVLLEGPPGTGKTLLARALAGECGANFIAVDGSHFSSMLYGAGIGKVRELFATARKNGPCIVFIDEFDGIGKRSSGPKVSGGASEENRIINKLLVEMDGFGASDNVVVIGATNHAGNVDDALKRPGRFDLVARVSLPTLHERHGVFERCLGLVKSDGRIDAMALARSASGLSHADITNVVNRATVAAAQADCESVTQAHLHHALESHQLGGEVSSMKSMITPEARRRIAIHEGGHAVVAHVRRAGRVERVSIEPRGHALGVTFVTRTDEVPLYGERELHGRLAMLLAGREAELLVFGNTTSGASDDLKRASELAIDMVSSMGFSSEFGLLSLAGVPESLIGPQLQERVLTQARVMLDDAQRLCRETLIQQRAALDALAEALLHDEVVGGEWLDERLPLASRAMSGDARDEPVSGPALKAAMLAEAG
ncbi:MAG: ftsH [Rhizobacter sp.]|nr:ftsH [Rhizobacter sp.]